MKRSVSFITQQAWRFLWIQEQKAGGLSVFNTAGWSIDLGESEHSFRTFSNYFILYSGIARVVGIRFGGIWEKQTRALRERLRLEGCDFAADRICLPDYISFSIPFSLCRALWVHTGD